MGKKIITIKDLYDLIESTGETLTGSLHIIDSSGKYKTDEKEGKFRIYHSAGYCFDVEKEYICEPDEKYNYDDVQDDGFNYTFYAEWEGFNNSLNISGAYELIKRTTNIPFNHQ